MKNKNKKKLIITVVFFIFILTIGISLFFLGGFGTETNKLGIEPFRNGYFYIDGVYSNDLFTISPEIFYYLFNTGLALFIISIIILLSIVLSYYLYKHKYKKIMEIEI